MGGMKWLDEKEGKSGMMDTYMDTMPKIEKHLNRAKSLL